MDHLAHPCAETARSHLHGQSAMTIVWWFLGAVRVDHRSATSIGDQLPHIASFLFRSDLSWMTMRWFSANLVSKASRLGLSLRRPVLDLSGLACPGALSAITIIGWAWVYTAQMRWICRNVEGTRREIVFNATGPGICCGGPLSFASAARSSSRFHGSLRWYDELVCLAVRAGRASARTTPPRRRFTCAGAASLPGRPKPPACRPA